MKTKSMVSIVIPVYHSERIVAETVSKTIEEMKKTGYLYEIILVNDGSKDNSWSIIRDLAEQNENIKSINLIKNYGQHTAVLCGIKHSKGDYIVTMDDDLQNPPQEIIKLVKKIEEGFDLVFGKFPKKKHAGYRKFGTLIINQLNRYIFGKPNHIALSNFRIFTRKVGQRVSCYKTLYPYIPGLLLMFSGSIANVETEHCARTIGKSNYSMLKILYLVARLLFNYSSFPLKFLAVIGFAISVLSFAVGIYLILKAVFIGTQVPGWTSISVLLSFFNGFIIIMLGVMGEYLSRILNQVSIGEPYQIDEIVGSE